MENARPFLHFFYFSLHCGLFCARQLLTGRKSPLHSKSRKNGGAQWGKLAFFRRIGEKKRADEAVDASPARKNLDHSIFLSVAGSPQARFPAGSFCRCHGRCRPQRLAVGGFFRVQKKTRQETGSSLSPRGVYLASHLLTLNSYSSMSFFIASASLIS